MKVLSMKQQHISMERIELVDAAAAGTLQQICLLEMLMRLLVLPASGVASFFYSVT